MATVLPSSYLVGYVVVVYVNLIWVNSVYLNWTEVTLSDQIQ